jgi:hypothetical protein
MELTPPNLPTRSDAPWPNMIIFPQELKKAIPDYGSRALVFGSVSGFVGTSPVSVAGMVDETAFDMGRRTQLQLVVHETGALQGEFKVLIDLDTVTTRDLGEFLIRLADRAEQWNG